ncbi:hypothetical protein VTO73DRAFT_8621 [Trametes versicolor]
MNSTSALPQSPLLPPRVRLGPAYGTFLICSTALHCTKSIDTSVFTAQTGSSSSTTLAFFVFDALHTILAVHMNYANLVSNFFTPALLQRSLWSLNMQPLTTGIIIVLCQSFFAARVYKVDKRYRTLLAIAIVMFLVELAFTVKGFAIGTIERLNKYAWMQSGGFGVVISADIMLTFVLVLALHQRRTGFKITNSKIDLLIAYTIGTGFVTLVFAMACFITALASPGDLLFGALDLICVKVYINSVLATLNMRPSAASGRSGDRHGTIDLCALPQSRSAQDIEKEWPSSSTESTNGVEPATVVSIKVTNDLSHRV